MAEVKLTNNQKEILKQFKANLADLLNAHHTDTELLKWLRAKNFDLKKSEKNFKQVDIHRKMFNVEKINDIYVKPKVIQEYERTCFLGFCKDGTPLRYANVNADVYGFVQSMSQFDISMYFLNLMEGDIQLARTENLKTGQDNTSITFIFDLDGYNFQDLSHKCVIETAIEYVNIVQDYYPEIWRHILVINAPYIFYKILHIFKPLLKQTFIDKVRIASKGTTLDLLKEFIEDDVIPDSLKELVKPYGKIPKEYYLKNSMHFIDETDPGVKMTTIRAKGSYNVPLVFKEAGNSIRIEFRTENGPIKVMLLYQQLDLDSKNPCLPASDEYLDPDDESSNVLLAVLKIKCQSHITPNDGTFTVVSPGIYIFQFDNTASWFGCRKLYYRVTVSSPAS